MYAHQVFRIRSITLGGALMYIRTKMKIKNAERALIQKVCCVDALNVLHLDSIDLSLGI